MTNSQCLRTTAALLLGAALLHALLAVWLNPTSALLLLAPYAMLAGTTWLLRAPWIVVLSLGLLLLLEACAVTTYVAAGSSGTDVVIPLFGIAASAVQLPIAALVAVVRYLENAS
ncbi:MAG: hypothetical protein QM756_38580 [Polyangiaceae bacterium]